MILDDWLDPSLAIPQVAASTAGALARAVAERMAPATGLEADVIEAAFREAMDGEGFSIGEGVAIPHTEVEGLSETVICLVTLAEPLDLKTLDGRSPDIFVFILSRRDPQEHLLLLAHLARLMHSRTFVAGLRRAEDAGEMVELVRAAEARQRSLQGAAPVSPATSHALIVMSIGGEKLVDAVLIDLVDQGYGRATILEAQSLNAAAAREVPLFAGFRDLFGDPGGRRVLFLEVPADQTDAIIETVRRICERHETTDARVSVMPIQTCWTAPAPDEEEEAAAGH